MRRSRISSLHEVIKVFSVPREKLFEEFFIKNFALKAADFQDEEARINEIKRVISTLGVDKRDEINTALLLELTPLLENQKIETIGGKKHTKKKNTRLYKVSSAFFEVFSTEIDTKKLTSRSGLNAFVVVTRSKDKGQKKESYDLLEYRDGSLLFLIAGGAGESIIDNIGELAKDIGITIPAHIQWTYRERKEREKEAAETLQEIYEDSKESKKK